MALTSNELFTFSTLTDGVLHVQLSRKPVNAFHEQFWTEFGRVFDTVSDDPSIRAVVLSSRIPKFFSAGLDLKDATLLRQETISDPGRKGFANRALITRFQHAISSVERCTQPVIVAVHGLALGLSIDIMTACDVRYAAEDAVFAVKEVDIGLAADIGTLARLPKAASNESLVRELALTARNFTASEALGLGLVSKVVEGSRDEVVNAALQTAKLIASKSPVAVAGTKRLLVHARDHSVSENLDYTASWNAFALLAEDTNVAIKAVLEKKRPKFEGLPKLKGKL